MKYDIGDVLVWQSGVRILEGEIVRIIPAGVCMAEVYGVGTWTNELKRYASDRYVLHTKGHPRYSAFALTCTYLDPRAQKVCSKPIPVDDLGFLFVPHSLAYALKAKRWLLMDQTKWHPNIQKISLTLCDCEINGLNMNP